MSKNLNSKFVNHLFRFLNVKDKIIYDLRSRLLNSSLFYLFGDIDKTERKVVEDRIKTQLFKKDSSVLCSHNIEKYIYNFVKKRKKQEYVFNDKKTIAFFKKAGLNTKTQRMENIMKQFNFDYVNTKHGATPSQLKNEINALEKIEAIKLVMFAEFLIAKNTHRTSLPLNDYIDFDFLSETEYRKLNTQVQKCLQRYNNLLRGKK